MGLVVQFGLPVMRPRRRKSDRPCEVTIFPGVRYERPDAERDATRLPDPMRGHVAAGREIEKH
jgi:hypothetical protein